MICGQSLLGQTGKTPRKLRIAGIGIGGMGKSNLTNVANEEIVGLCDVDHAFAEPVFSNTCYSYVSNTEAVHVAAVYRFDPAKQSLVAAEGSGVSEKRNPDEAKFAAAWAKNIWADSLM